MARRTAWLHVGPAGTGATALAPALAAHADALAERGLSLPVVSAEEALRVALEVRRDHRAWGYRRAEVEGTWARVCRRAHKAPGSPVVVSELLAAASRDQVDLLLDGLAPMRAHVVVNLRDPATRLLDAWADEVRGGQATSFARFAERLLDLEQVGSRRYWAGQHAGEVLDRWSGAVGRDRVHVVVLPREGDARTASWTGFCDVLGLDPAAFPLPGGPAPDPRPARRPRVPDALQAELTALAGGWRSEVVDRGYDVHGDLDDLLPAPLDPADPLPDDVPLEDRLASTTDVLADVLDEVHRLRQHNAVLERRACGVDRVPQPRRTRRARRRGAARVG